MEKLMNVGSVLGRSEMRKIMAGSGENTCRIYHYLDGWSGCSWTPSEAQAWYNGYEEITGWCCASCANRCY